MIKALKIPFIISIVFLTCCQKNPLPDVSPLKCNYSSADISTLEGEQVSLAGFSDRKELSTGTHLKIRTYCLVITDGPNYAYKLRTVETIVANAVKTVKDEKAFREFSLEVGKTTTDIPGNRCEKEGPVDADVYAARFVSKGGEPFCEYQMETREAFQSETVFFAGYTNGQNAYLASKRGYQVRKGYEYEIEQMHVYTKSPYPLSETMPDVYQASVTETISNVL